MRTSGRWGYGAQRAAKLRDPPGRDNRPWSRVDRILRVGHIHLPMRVTVHDPRRARLVLCGVPFAPGALPAGAGLAARVAAGTRLPLWFAVRSRWPDGSAKWAFVHARLDLPGLPRDEDGDPLDLLLETVHDAGPAPGAAALDASVLSLGDTRLEIGPTGLWRLSRGGHHLRLSGTRAAAAGIAATATAPVEATVLEPSPLAPLVRLRQVTAAGLRYDHLLRLEPDGGLHWQQRVSFLTAEVTTLRCLTARLEVGPAPAAWRWPGLDPAPRRLLAAMRPGRLRRDAGPDAAGFPTGRLACDTASIWLEKAWQRAPFALEAAGADVDVAFFPDGAEPLPVHPGTSLRHSLRVRLGGGEALAPARWSLDPQMACATGAFGPLMARTETTARRYPGYEQAMTVCLHSGRLSALEKERGGTRGAAASLADEAAQDEEYFGLPHYGDWPMGLGAYGGVRRMYAANEYDTPYAYWLQFARTGATEYAEVAAVCAVHMADLDCRADNGDMRFHGYLETADDHGAHRAGGDLGHYWTDGMMLAWLLGGDLWSGEAARALAGFLCARFAGAGDASVRQAFLGCERAVGWPLVALAGVAEVDGDAAGLDRMARMSAYLARFTADPDRELEEAGALGVRWWRICQQDGTKPFMLGVVMEGLERHHRLSGDANAATALVRIARFLVDVMWVEGIEAFRYEWNAFNRPHREEVYPHYINTMVAPGLAYAYQLTGERVFRDVATRSFHAALWTLLAPGGGKEIGMVGRTSSLMVARLAAWHEADESERARRQAPSPGVPFRFRGTAEALHGRPDLAWREGAPAFVDGALVSGADSCAVYGFLDLVSTERGRVAFTVVPDWDCPPHPGPVAQRAYLHLCGRPFTASCLSVISFYTGLHARFHDGERHYIEVLETSIQDWRAGVPHRVEVEWDGAAGWARLAVDGRDADRRHLPRRLSGAFQRLHLGHRPGNWRADARLTDLELDLG